MAEGENIKEFPDVKDKLAAPKKLSAFERDRQAAEAKRLRAEAENAAALKAFQDSFDHDDDAEDDDDMVSRIANGRGPPTGPRGAGMGFGARYGTSSGPRSGPGSLGPGPGLPPPGMMKRKRATDEFKDSHDFGRQRDTVAPRDNTQYMEASHVDEDQEPQAPKPTIALSSLPPGTSEADVRALLENYLQIHSVELSHMNGPGARNGRISCSAIVTLTSETSTPQIDNAVSTLKQRYLSCGYFLSISRHLSSTALHPTMATVNTTSTEPFGAERPRDTKGRGSMRNAPPPMEHRGFAPPSSYESPSRPGYGMPGTINPCVSVQPPRDIQSVRAIHTVVDRICSEPDPARALQLEAMLMAQPKVQTDERFAFLYDSRSPGGIYYRYLLWRPEDSESVLKERKRISRGPERVFGDVPIDWANAKAQIPFPDLTNLAEVVDDIDYNSSEEESDDEGGERRFNDSRGEGPESEEFGKNYFTPLQHARFVHLLARLPTAHTRLRRGDVARITNFAINHAGYGAEEIVDLLLLNIARPFSSTLAAKFEGDVSDEADEDDEDEPRSFPTLGGLPSSAGDSKRDDDPSAAKLVGLYLISDILSASLNAAGKKAWKYRQLFETGFKSRGTFQHLGRLDKDFAWGRLKAEQWKRKVDVIFDIWSRGSIFASDILEGLRNDFFSPPLTDEERLAEERRVEKEEKKAKVLALAGKFKRVGSESSPGARPGSLPDSKPSSEAKQSEGNDDVDGEPMDDVDGEPMDDDDVDGEPMSDVESETTSHLKQAMGNSIADHSIASDQPRPTASTPPNTDGDTESNQRPTNFSLSAMSRDNAGANSKSLNSNGKTKPGRRMRAEDMFADSDEGE